MSCMRVVRSGVGGFVRFLSEGREDNENLYCTLYNMSTFGGKRHLLCTHYFTIYHRGVPDALDLERDYISRGRRRSHVLYCGAPAHDDTR